MPRLLFTGALLALAFAAPAESAGYAHDGPAPRIAGWRLGISRAPGSGASAMLAATRTKPLRGSYAASTPAILEIRCIGESKLGLFVSFPERASRARAIARYGLGSSSVRRLRPRREGMAWRGASRMIREIAHADVLVVEMEDVELGRGEAVFRLAGAEKAVRRVRSACAAGERAPSPTASSTSPAAAARPGREHSRRPFPPPQSSRAKPDATQMRARPFAKQDRSASAGGSQGAVTPKAGPEQDSNSSAAGVGRSEEADKVRDVETPAVSPTVPAPPLPAGERATEPTQTPGPPTQDEKEREADISQREAPRSATPEAAETPAATPPPRPADLLGEEPKQSARLAAFLQKHGPNRKGELIYDWYKQCLAFAGIDSERVWYLSNEQLAYLSKGEIDQVRLSMLISTTRNLDVPPRRITCYGTARGRDLMIDKSE